MFDLLEVFIQTLTTLFKHTRAILTEFLEQTTFYTNPELAASYGDILFLLLSAVTLYIVLTFASFFKKILSVLIAVGCSLFIISLAMSLI